MDKMRAQWAETSTRSKIILGVCLAAAVVFAAMSFGGFNFVPPPSP